jgi:hypothetical protein
MLDTAPTAAETATESKQLIPVWSWRDAIAKANVPPLTKLVCYDISRYLSDAGKSWRVPVKDIMRDTGLSNWAVAAHLKHAVDAGLLVIKREIGPSGQRGVSRYVPRFPANMVLDHEPAEPMQDEAPREPASHGNPRECRSSRKAHPREAASPSQVSEAHDKYLSTNKTIHQPRDFPPEGDAQARPAPEVAEISVSQPKAKKPKAGKTDLLGEVPTRNKRNTLTPFPESPDPDVVAQWVAYGVRLGLTEDDAKGCLLKEGKYYRGTGKRMADWTPIMEGELIKCRERLAKERKRERANGAKRSINDDAFAMAFGA